MSRILVTGYCQAVGLAYALQAILPDATVQADAAKSDLDDSAMAAFQTRLREVDYWFPANYLEVRRWPAFAAIARHTRVIPAPYFWFSGFHPDQCSLRSTQADTPVKPDCHSAIVAWAYRHDLPVHVVPLLFQDDVFAALGYFDAWNDAVDVLRTDLAALGWQRDEADDLYLSLKQQRVFMHAFNHPKPAAFVEIAKLIARRAGLAINEGVQTEVPDTLFAEAFPVYPPLAPLLGVLSPGYVWRHGKQRLRDVQTYAAFMYQYFYDQRAVSFAKSLKPSPRGELEITDLNRLYMEQDALSVQIMGRGYAWFDTGTHDSLLEAGQFISTIERRQGLKVSCPEEIAFRKGWIDAAQLERLAEPLLKNNYGRYLLGLLKQRVF